jgi:hypothetical protein
VLPLNKQCQPRPVHAREWIDALNRLKPDIPITAHATGVDAALSSINSTILHFKATPFQIPVTYATPRPPTGGSPSTNRKIVGYNKLTGEPIYANAVGTKTNGREIALIGEDGPEYVIPVGAKHKASGMALWMQAGKDVGIPGYAKGKSPKPGKTPPPIQHGLGYDPSALDTQMRAEKSRPDDAHSYRDTLKGRLTTDGDRYGKLSEEIAAAKKATGSKNAKTAAATRIRLSKLTAEQNRLKARMVGETNAYERQINTAIPADTKRYQAATAAAKVGNEHAGKIDLWQTRADSDTSAMQLASDQWDAAKDPASKARAYKAWDAARKARIGDLSHVRDLLKEVKAVVGKTKYGAEIAGQLSTTIGAIVQAQDDTAAPGYVEAQAPSTDISDYLYQAEKDALAQSALEMASASATDSTADDVTAAQGEYAVNHWILDRLAADGASVDILTQAFQAVASAKSDLESAISGNTSSSTGGTTSGVTADQQAALDQQTARAKASDEQAASDRAALQTFQQSGDLFRGQQSVYVNVTTLSAEDPQVQRQVGSEVSKALGSQNAVPATTGFYSG